MNVERADGDCTAHLTATSIYRVTVLGVLSPLTSVNPHYSLRAMRTRQ